MSDSLAISAVTATLKVGARGHSYNDADSRLKGEERTTV